MLFDCTSCSIFRNVNKMVLQIYKLYAIIATGSGIDKTIHFVQIL